MDRWDFLKCFNSLHLWDSFRKGLYFLFYIGALRFITLQMTLSLLKENWTNSSDAKYLIFFFVCFYSHPYSEILLIEVHAIFMSQVI